MLCGRIDNGKRFAVGNLTKVPCNKAYKKVKLFLCLIIIKFYAMKAYGGGDLTSVLAGGEWSASRTGRLTPGGRTFGTSR
jgi:hypothetical protein